MLWGMDVQSYNDMHKGPKLSLNSIPLKTYLCIYVYSIVVEA